MNVAFSFVPFKSDRYLDKKEILEEARLNMNCLDDESDDPKVTSLIPAINKKIIEEKYKWEPSAKLVLSLKKMIWLKKSQKEIENGN